MTAIKPTNDTIDNKAGFILLIKPRIQMDEVTLLASSP